MLALSAVSCIHSTAAPPEPALPCFFFFFFWGGAVRVEDTAVILRSKALPLQEFMVPRAGRN